MSIDILKLLRKDPELLLLAEFGMKRGVRFVPYSVPYLSDYPWYFDPDPATVSIPVFEEYECILPFDDPMIRRFRLAHELGHAVDFTGQCPNQDCFKARYKNDWCVMEERRAWLAGLRILEEVLKISAETKERYLTYALLKIKSQSKHCIRYLMLNPAKLLESDG